MNWIFSLWSHWVIVTVSTFNTDKNNNVSFEGLDKHFDKYHSSSYRTRCDTSDNACLDLQNSRYPILIEHIKCFPLIFQYDVMIDALCLTPSEHVWRDVMIDTKIGRWELWMETENYAFKWNSLVFINVIVDT